jgi:hypothetical protein
LASVGLAAGNTLAVSPFSSQVVLVGTEGRGIYRLDGSSWVTTSLSTGTVHYLVFDRSKSERVLAAVDAASGGILASINNGQSWIPSNSGLSGKSVYSLAQSASNPSTWLAGTSSGIYQSVNGGTTWIQAGLAGDAVNAVGIFTANGSTMYFAGTDRRAYFRQDNVLDWGTINSAFSNVGIQGILRDPNRSSVYFYTRLGGIIRIDLQ